MALLSFSVAVSGCEYCVDAGVCSQDPEKMARYVTAPLDSIGGNYEYLDGKYQEAAIRLTSVRDSAVRAQLAGILDQKYAFLGQEKLASEQKKAQAAARASTIDAIRMLERGLRESSVGEGYVLQLRNSADVRVELDLKCFTQRNTYSKTIFVSVPARGTSEIGWIEGWAFQPGHYCTASYQGERMWDLRV
ncbi:MAG TPA: hypothetical protein VHG91_08165 [Longimicrobium sp.]|nr:hypothetical protein [Longimicrobium sp.]